MPSERVHREMKMAPSVEQALRLKLETQGLAGVDARTSIDHVRAAVETQRPNVSTHAAPDGRVTIMFEDIAASTARAEELGDERWLALIRSHNTIVRDQIEAHGGHEVSNRGDGFMVVFASPKAGVECAIAIQRAFSLSPDPSPLVGEGSPEGSGSPSPSDGRGGWGVRDIEIHIGLHTGNPARDEGNFYGTDVNLAARIADHVAQAGEIVVSERLREALRRSRTLKFDEGREVELKGLSGKQRVFEVTWT